MKKHINIFRIQSWRNVIKILIIAGTVFLPETGFSEFTTGEVTKCRNYCCTMFIKAIGVVIKHEGKEEKRILHSGTCELLEDFDSHDYMFCSDLELAFSKERDIEESDIDIAVYLKENRAQINNIWPEVTSLVNREVDLIDMKEAPATLVSNILKTGMPLTIKDRNLYWNIFLEKSLEAEDFCRFMEDYRRIYQKAK